MPQTTTPVSSCDVVLELDDCDGTLHDISGSTNRVAFKLANEVGSFQTMGGRARGRLCCRMDGNLVLGAVYSTASDEAMDLLKQWWNPACRCQARTLRVHIPDDSPASDHYSGEFYLARLETKASAAESGPIAAAAVLVPTGEITLVSHGMLLLSQNQLAVSYDFFDGAPTWVDVSAGLTGVFHNVVTDGEVAYAATADGLWYSPSVTAFAWNCIVTDAQAEVDTGYTGHFGSLAINPGGLVLAPFHIGVGAVPGRMYVAQGGVGAWQNFPTTITGNPGLTRDLGAWTLHCVSYDPARARFYLCFGATGVPWNPSVAASADGVAWVTTDFTGAMPPFPQFQMYGGYGGWVGHTELGGNAIVWRNWDPADSVAATVWVGMGVHAEGGVPLWTGRVGLFDLFRDYVEIGDADSPVTGFGVGRVGGLAQFVPGSAEQIAWVCGNAAQQLSGHRVVIYTANGGATWADYTGDFYTAIGPTWSGAGGGANYANAVCRIFSY